MITFYDKMTFWLVQRFFNGPTLLKPSPEKTDGYSILSGPFRKALSFVVKFDQYLACCFRVVSAYCRSRKSFLYSPSGSDSPCNDGFTKAKLFCPRAYYLRPSHECNVHIAFHVSLLNFWRRPSTVFWRISKSSVFSVYRHTIRALSHVFQKVFKRLPPPITNKYSNSAISVKFSVVGSVASSNHVLICGVRPTLPVELSMPMFRSGGVQAFGGAIGPHLTLAAFVRRAVERIAAYWAYCACHKFIISNKVLVQAIFVGLTVRRQAEYKECIGETP